MTLKELLEKWNKVREALQKEQPAKAPTAKEMNNAATGEMVPMKGSPFATPLPGSAHGFLFAKNHRFWLFLPRSRRCFLSCSFPPSR